tara:strand:+ start:348 stop:626 length:279 start_codon:yes stop_codon:yes gene_type:complete
MNLYTVVLEFRLGTYINQFYTKDPMSACVEFIQQLEVKTVFGMEGDYKQRMLDDLNDGDHNPVPLRGLSHVWYTSIMIDDHLAEFNIVLTSP